MQFDFETIRRLQRECADEPICEIDFNQDARLVKGFNLMETNKLEAAIKSISKIIKNRGLEEVIEGENKELERVVEGERVKEDVVEQAEASKMKNIGKRERRKKAKVQRQGEGTGAIDNRKEELPLKHDDVRRGLEGKRIVEEAAIEAAGLEVKEGADLEMMVGEEEEEHKKQGAIPKRRIPSSDLSKINTRESRARQANTILAEAYLLRAKVHLKARNFVKARNDAQECIILRPSLMPAYLILSEAELNRRQYGRAEVALVLGRKFDPGNEDLALHLQQMRGEADPKLLPQIVHWKDNPAYLSVIEQSREDGVILGYEDFSHLPPIVNFLMSGDFHNLVRIWSPEMIHYRFLTHQQSVIHFPALGIQRLDKNGDPTRAKAKARIEDYKKVYDFLFDQGARLDARDKVGYTALFHLLSINPQPELLEHLLQKGADPNVQSILGTVPLYDATVNQDPEGVQLLLSHGANPHIKDGNGYTSYETATKDLHMFAVYDKFFLPGIPERICQVCTEKGTKRCLKCRVAFYCGSECQRADWTKHKKQCEQLIKGHKRLIVAKNSVEVEEGQQFVSSNTHNWYAASRRQTLIRRGFDEPASKMNALKTSVHHGDKLFDIYSQEYKKKGNLLVKIQCMLKFIPGPGLEPRRAINRDAGFRAYNEDRSFDCWLDAHAGDAEEVRAILTERGKLAFKGYFWAFMEPGKNEVVIITEPRIPAQPW